MKKEIREAIAAQRWHAVGETVEMDGLTLAKRMVERGTFKKVEPIQHYRIGDCIATGVSAWERVA